MVLVCLLEFVLVILSLYVPTVGSYHVQNFIMDGQSGLNKRGKTYYHSLNDDGTAYIVVAWIVAAAILICLIIYLCNHHSILLNKILRFVLLAMTPILPIMYFVALGEANTYTTENLDGFGSTSGIGSKSCANFWGVLFVMAFIALFGYLVYQCITNSNPKIFSPRDKAEKNDSWKFF